MSVISYLIEGESTIAFVESSLLSSTVAVTTSYRIFLFIQKFPKILLDLIFYMLFAKRNCECCIWIRLVDMMKMLKCQVLVDCRPSDFIKYVQIFGLNNRSACI